MKSLIVYFTKTGENWYKDGLRDLHVGNCCILANKLKEITGGDVFELIPNKEYPFGYEECCKVAKIEHDKNIKIEYLNKPNSIDEYKVIYVVFPCWYGTYPQVVKTFIHDFVFDNKTIKFICSNEGSGLGNSQKDFNKDLPNINVCEGLSILGYKSNDKETEEILKKWVI